MYQKILSGLNSKKNKYIAKAISLVEDGDFELFNLLNLDSNNSYRIGITGPPGAGKSSITNELIKYFRKLNKKVGVLLVDPTSPFTSGAVLGDRIRMNEFHQDSGVYIRSLATRGSKGGLSNNINYISDILEYAGYDIIIFETVGVGQVELDVVESVDTVLVTLVPESGDDIQIMKAGLIEIADIYIINKYDRKDSDKLYLFLTNMLSMIEKKQWKPSIVKTIAIKSEGINELGKQILDHQNYLISTNDFLNKKNHRFIKSIKNRLVEDFLSEFWNKKRMDFLNNELSKKTKKKKRINEIIKDLKSI